MLNPRVVSVKCLSEYRLRLMFTDGEQGIYSLAPLLNFGVFKELQDESYFNRVRVENGTVVWPHEQDICPDTLYLESVKLKSQIDP